MLLCVIYNHFPPNTGLSKMAEHPQASSPDRERTGRYVQQPQGYRAFIPRALPPDPPLRLSPGMQQLLSQADRALGRLSGSAGVLPSLGLFVYEMHVRKEAVLSSRIEGTRSSLQDLLIAEAGVLPSGRPDDVAEVTNYVRAFNYGLYRLEELPVCVRLLCEMHELLLQGVRGAPARPGLLRESQNWLGPAGCDRSEATFIPPPPAEVPAALGELEKFLNAPGGLPPLVWIGLAHAQFETIHPFLDGNGRLGRLLISLLLAQQQILQKPVLYLSDYFYRHRLEYYDRLQAVHEQGDWEGWIEFFLQGVADVSQDAAETIQHIYALREKHRAEINMALGRAAGNGLRILEFLYSQPLFTVPRVQGHLGVSYASANQLVSRLEKLGILEEISGRKRNRVYRYSSYLELFEKNPPPNQA